MTENAIIEIILNNAPKLISPVKAVAGTIFATYFLRRNTNVEEFEKIKQGKLSEVVDDLLDHGVMTYTEFYKAKNFARIAEKADEYYRRNNHQEFSSDNEYEFDWYLSFYEAVGNISNEELQEFWAKLLAGEVAEKGSFSLRTISILRNMGSYEASLFVKIANCSIIYGKQCFLPNYQEFLEKESITYSDVLQLDELGLINSNSLLLLENPVCEDGRIISRSRDIVLMVRTKDGQPNKFSIKQFPLTSSGRQLATLIGAHISNDGFLEFCKALKADHAEFNISAHRVVSEKNNDIEYEIKDLI